MAKNFGRVNVSVTASTGGLTANLTKASKSVRGFQSQIQSMAGSMRTLVFIQGAQLFGSFASSALGAARSLIQVGQAAAESIDQQSKLSRRLGVTYAELAGLKLAGDLAGVGVESIATAMTKADVAFVKAQNGSKQAQSAFATLGLTTEQLGGMTSAERFEAIADAIAKLPTEAERSAAAIALFGRSGAQLLPLFEGGAASIRQARLEAEQFGLTLTGVQGRNVEEMNDSFTRVSAAIQGIVQQVVAYLAPAITGVVNKFLEFVKQAGGATIGQAIGDALMAGAEVLAGIGDWLVSGITTAFQYVSQVSADWSSTVTFMQQVVAAMRAMFDAAAVLFLATFRAAMTPMSNIIEQLARMASNLPGVAGRVAKQVADSTKGFRDALDSQIEGFANDALQNMDFATELNPGQAGQAMASPMLDAVRQFRQGAREAASAIDSSMRPNRAGVREQIEAKVRISSQDLKAIVAGTSEGESFRNSIMRGLDARLSRDNMAASATAENTGEMVGQLDALNDSLADMQGMGLAAIQV